MEDVAAALLKEWKGKRVLIKTVAGHDLEGELGNIGPAYLVLEDTKSGTVLVSLAGVVSVERTTKPVVSSPRVGVL